MRAIFIVTLLTFTLSGCVDPSVICDESSSEVSFARTISNERLEKVFYDTNKLKSSGKIINGGPVPDEFIDLNVKAIRVHQNVHLRLKGCMDHHIDLVVTDDTNPQIELRWGEHKPGKEVLWKK